MFAYTTLRTVKKTLYILFAIALLISCRDNGAHRTLQSAEQLLETDVVAADSILESMTPPLSKRGQAWYAVLKTQADYKQYKPITSDSLILTATNYYGSHRKSYRSAMAWYSQGCVYSEMKDDVSAIDSYLKAIDLFPDTLIRYFALTEQQLGKCYLEKSMYKESMGMFLRCRNNACRLKDSTIIAYSDYHLALIKLHNNRYEGLDDTFINLTTNKHLTKYYRNESLVQLAKYHLFHSCNYDSAFYYLDRKIAVSANSSLGATYNLKGEIFYKLGIIDSSYYYIDRSLKEPNDIYTQCESYRRLSEMSALLGNNLEAFNYGKLYTECLDSIRVLTNANDIAAISIAHKTEMETLKRKEYRNKTIISGVLILLVVVSILYVSYLSHINKINRRSIEFSDSMWAKINTTLPIDGSEEDYLETGKTRYLNSPSHFMLIPNNQNQTLRKEEKEAVKHDISVAVSDLMAKMFNDYPSINNKEVLLCILSFLDVNKNMICSILDLSDDNYRKLKSRLKDKLKGSYELYFHK